MLPDAGSGGPGAMSAEDWSAPPSAPPPPTRPRRSPQATSRARWTRPAPGAAPGRRCRRDATGVRPPTRCAGRGQHGHRALASSDVEFGRGGRCFDVTPPQCPTDLGLAPRDEPWLLSAPSVPAARRWPGRHPVHGVGIGAGHVGPGSRRDATRCRRLAVVPRRADVDRNDCCRRSATCPRVSSALW